MSSLTFIRESVLPAFPMTHNVRDERRTAAALEGTLPTRPSRSRYTARSM